MRFFSLTYREYTLYSGILFGGYVIARADLNLIDIDIVVEPGAASPIPTIDWTAELKKSLDTDPFDWDVADRSLANGADIKVTDARGETYLHKAVRVQDENRVQLALGRGADPNVINASLNTPMGQAAYLGNVRIMNILKDKGANLHSVNTPNGPVNSAAIMACLGGNLPAVKWLIAQGADVNEPGKDENVPLTVVASAKSERLDLLTELLEAGANPNVANRDKKSPLHLAVASGFKRIVSLLIARGAQVNALDGGDLTPLDVAEAGAQTSIATILRDSEGKTAKELMPAAGDTLP